MRGAILGLTAAFSVLAVLPAARAGTPYPVKMKCAVGGEAFTHTATGSYSTWGSRPDGKPYGSWIFPMPLPVCPGNGLVMYRDFDKAEIAALTGLVASPEYKALVAAKETPYYRAAWLEGRLKPGSEDVPWILLQATWEADDEPARQARYDREFVAAANAQPAKPTELIWAVLQARAANAERQLGDFDAAARRLAAVDPAVFQPRTDGQPDPDAKNRPGWAAFYKELSVVIARRDPAREPLDMIDEGQAAWLCKQMPDRSKAQPAGFCERPEIAKRTAEMRD
ncbi:MAG TPA: hypothetical protein VEA44_06895 [Caulobacter sp.]|nr:hypothetical protein [Caulobacter sp.]